MVSDASAEPNRAEVVARGVERGDLRADTDVRVPHELLVGPRICRLLFSGAPLDRRHATAVVDAVLAAFRPTDSSAAGRSAQAVRGHRRFTAWKRPRTRSASDARAA